MDIPDWFRPTVTKKCPKCHKIEKMYTVCLECLDRQADKHVEFRDEWEFSAECRDAAIENRKVVVALRNANVDGEVIRQQCGIDRQTFDWILKIAREKGEIKCTK